MKCPVRTRGMLNCVSTRAPSIHVVCALRLLTWPRIPVFLVNPV